jgi:SulP family sulfate permease
MTTSAQSLPKSQPVSLARYLPILGWLPRYNRAWLMGDIIAGLSVWALMVPQSLGYANISGVPVQYGLYAAAIALLVFPLFTTSRHVITGPSSTISAVTGSAVLLATTSDSPEAVQLVAAITIIAGLLYILLAILKMGWISNFLSESVLTGFIFGIGIDVVIGQLKKLTGTSESGDNAWQKLFSWIQGLPDTNIPTLILGAGLLIMLVLLHRYAPKVPGALLAVVIGIGAAMLLPLADMGVALTGTVPSGLPSFVLPSLDFITQNFAVIIPAAVGVLLVGFSESLAAARQYSAKYHYDIDVDQEMLAQGMANAAAGFFQGVNVDGSLSKSALNDSSGAKSQLSSIFQGIFVILTLLFLAPLFAYLPQAALGAIVITAVVFGLFKVAAMRRLARLSRTEFWLAMAALLGVLTFGTLQGIFIGVFLSLLWLIWRTSHPAIPVLGKTPDETAYFSVENHPEAIIQPGIVIVRFDGPLFFASAKSLRARVRELTGGATPPVHAVILDMESTNLIDLEGADELQEVAEELEELQIGFHLARVKAGIKEMLVRDGVLDTIPDERFHTSVDAAVKAALTAALTAASQAAEQAQLAES